MSDTRESLARALCWWLSAEGDCDCASVHECQSGLCDPTKLVDALTAQGLAIVPIEPTEEMCDAGSDSVLESYVGPTTTVTYGRVNAMDAFRIYKAMIKASEKT